MSHRQSDLLLPAIGERRHSVVAGGGIVISRFQGISNDNAQNPNSNVVAGFIPASRAGTRPAPTRTLEKS